MMRMKNSLRFLMLGASVLLLTSCGDDEAPKATDKTTPVAIVKQVTKATKDVSGTQEVFSSAQKSEIVKLVRKTLIENPEILLEVQDAYERKAREAQAKQEQQALTILSKKADLLYRSKTSPTAGNLKGDVTVVEFFDYNCGFCRKALNGILKAMESDKNLKVVFKEYPVFGGEPSVFAARAAHAARLQGRYMDFHKALFAVNGRVTENAVIRTAKEIGLDMGRLEKDMNSKEVSAMIQETLQLGRSLYIRGTPAFVMGGELVRGMPRNLPGYLKANAAKIRKNGCKNC